MKIYVLSRHDSAYEPAFDDESRKCGEILKVYSQQHKKEARKEGRRLGAMEKNNQWVWYEVNGYKVD